MDEIILNLISGIRNKLKANSLSVKDLSEMSNIPYETLKKILEGKIKNPSFLTIYKIKEALNVPLESLLTNSSKSNYLDTSALTTRCKKLIDSIIQIEEHAPKRNSKKYVPLFILNGYMRDGMNFDSSMISKIDISSYSDYYIEKVYCAIKITSDSFAPLYLKNDILLIGKDRQPNFGEISIFFHQNNIYLRRFSFANPILLEPINTLGRPLEITSPSEWIYFGYVVCVYR